MRTAVEPAPAREERLSRAALAICALAASVSACSITSPEVPPPDGTTDPREPFADSVISFGSSESPQFCTEDLPACEAEEPASCGPVAILGGPDGDVVVLGAGESIIVGFRCSSIREVGGVNSSDLTLWAQVPDGARAVLAVSLAGNRYETLDELNQTDQSFDLARIDLEVAQYLQIVHVAGDAIAIDAIEALR